MDGSEIRTFEDVKDLKRRNARRSAIAVLGTVTISIAAFILCICVAEGTREGRSNSADQVVDVSRPVLKVNLSICRRTFIVP